MDPFSQAFNLLKADHLINTYGEDFVLDILAKAMPGDPQIEALRQFVLMNDDTEDPELRAEVEAAYKYLTDISSGREAQMPHIRGYQAGGRGMTTPTPASSGPTPASYPRAEEKEMQTKSLESELANPRMKTTGKPMNVRGDAEEKFHTMQRANRDKRADEIAEQNLTPAMMMDQGGRSGGDKSPMASVSSPLRGARGGTVPVRPPKGRDSRTSMRGSASPRNPMDPPRLGSGMPDPERPKPFEYDDVKLAGTAISRALAHLGF
tara:strand:- start:6141 stop:6932 length:792 start_codon:yes stop_codon:yes gene_type:complete